MSMRRFIRSFSVPALAAAAAAAAVLLGLLAPARPAGAAAAAAAGPADIPVGVVLPISGREAKPGQYQREGIGLAIHEINQAGGVYAKQLGNNIPLRAGSYDDGPDRARHSAPVTR